MRQSTFIYLKRFERVGPRGMPQDMAFVSPRKRFVNGARNQCRHPLVRLPVAEQRYLELCRISPDVAEFIERVTLRKAY